MCRVTWYRQPNRSGIGAGLGDGESELVDELSERWLGSVLEDIPLDFPQQFGLGIELVDDFEQCFDDVLLALGMNVLGGAPFVELGLHLGAQGFFGVAPAVCCAEDG